MTGMDYGTELQLGHVSSGGVAVAEGILATIPEAATQPHPSSGRQMVEQSHYGCLVYGTQSTRDRSGEPQIRLS